MTTATSPRSWGASVKDSSLTVVFIYGSIYIEMNFIFHILFIIQDLFTQSLKF